MNKKDVLGASAAAGNIQKMESPPPVGAVPEMLKIRHSYHDRQGVVLALLLLSD